MNFLLLEAHEVAADGTALLTGRRADHVRSVLRGEVGQRLRAGIVDGWLGTAVIESLTADEVRVQLTPERQPPPVRDVLLLAVPRPRVLLRMLEHTAALGFDRIVLFRSWRVDKSWLESKALQPETQRQHLLLGLEQAGRTRLPRVQFCHLFRPMVEDELPRLDLPPDRFVAHPSATTATHRLQLPAGSPFVLALGPDGGFLPYEVDRLAEQGFAAVSCGPHPLRTETALAVLWGQLDLLRRRA